MFEHWFKSKYLPRHKKSLLPGHLHAWVFFQRIKPHWSFPMNPISTNQPVQGLVVVTEGGVIMKPESVNWTSANTDIATVDSATGVVTPVAVGNAVITANATLTQAGKPVVVSGNGVVIVTEIGGDLKATVDFQPIALPKK